MTETDPPGRAKRERKPVKSQWLDSGRLREAREAAGLKQAEVAARCDTVQNMYSHWETGAWGCDLPMVAKLAAALGKAPTDLMHDEGREAFAKLAAALTAA